MSLAALICAYHESEEPGGRLRAVLPLAGRTLVERQARLAAAAGAHPVVILVERMPAELVAAIDRMRTEGISAVVARTVSAAAEAVRPGDRLLLVADGLIADETHLSRLSAAPGSAILTVPDQAGDDRFERIDADSRWAGLALVEGDLLRDTASMLNDWDLQSTLLRRAVQGGARHYALKGELAGERLVIAERAADLAEMEAGIVEAAGAARDDWASHYLLAPVERAATRLLMPTAVLPEWLDLLAVVLTGVAAFLFGNDWIWAGLLLLLLATPLEGVADRLAALRLQGRGDETSWWHYVMPALAGAALLALGWSLSPARGWGCLALAATALAFLFALHGETQGREMSGRRWLAERKGLTWLMLPFAAAGLWVTGLVTLACYAAGSFFWAQRQAHSS
ncbi:hypothetical protein [Allosphingosinicella humi]